MPSSETLLTKTMRRARRRTKKGVGTVCRFSLDTDRQCWLPKLVLSNLYWEESHTEWDLLSSLLSRRQLQSKTITDEDIVQENPEIKVM